MASNQVPKTSAVVPGAGVSIVLKEDQRTGREVQGTVRDVLTRGDHHRGIKVRLTDGQIGRVQRMSTRPADATASSQAPLVADAPVAPGENQTSTPGTAPRPPQSFARILRHRDIRLDEPLEAPPAQIDLSAYIVAPKRKGKGRKPKPEPAGDASQSGDAPREPQATDVASASVKCPVCGAFEGDEAAVAHHVSSHFE